MSMAKQTLFEDASCGLTLRCNHAATLFSYLLECQSGLGRPSVATVGIKGHLEAKVMYAREFLEFLLAMGLGR